MQPENIIERDLVKSMKPKVINVPQSASGSEFLITSDNGVRFIYELTEKQEEAIRIIEAIGTTIIKYTKNEK